ncbi:acetolactate synthase small subunit [Candidatus Gottesmanbacteria bacterium RIFCSPLOWO2_01_FULL_39_12b]|uniref:Acetolactate synthase small subunit n=1 Tax=Candidatus Gottesmanbacteria bacterium RIFCSPLOWO2_01_FULL_39_12b TaxID=1798388 RepID=A0A1F6ANW2_9BACT|nr:MAG: acetolactate synthase small subunit [Candidatus Gottesmanbacteria bacterium RIFCSPLOWO2_01_FULL_39_12b]
MNIKNNLSTLIVSVQNRPGVLFRIAGLIRRRRFNIESLTVSHTENPQLSRFTILVRGDKETVEKMSKQLYRIVEVLKVSDPKDVEIVAKELALIKVSIKKDGSRVEITNIANHFRARVVNVNPEYMILEVTGNEEKIDAFYENTRKFGIIEFVRTGRTALFK